MKETAYFSTETLYLPVHLRDWTLHSHLLLHRQYTLHKYHKIILNIMGPILLAIICEKSVIIYKKLHAEAKRRSTCELHVLDYQHITLHNRPREGPKC